MENIGNLILDILCMRYLSLSGDVKSSVKFISLAFWGEIWAVDINLRFVGTLVEFRSKGLHEITKYASEVQKGKCLRTESWEFHTFEIREIRSDQQS